MPQMPAHPSPQPGMNPLQMSEGLVFVAEEQLSRFQVAALGQSEATSLMTSLGTFVDE